MSSRVSQHAESLYPTRLEQRTIPITGVAKQNTDSVRTGYSELFGIAPKRAEGDQVSLVFPPSTKIKSHRGFAGLSSMGDTKSMGCIIPVNHSQSTAVEEKFDIIAVELDADSELPPAKAAIRRELTALRTAHDTLEVTSKPSGVSVVDQGSLWLRGLQSRAIPNTNNPESNVPCEVFCTPDFAIATSLCASHLGQYSSQASSARAASASTLKTRLYKPRTSFSLQHLPAGEAKRVAALVRSLLRSSASVSVSSPGTLSVKFDASKVEFRSHKLLAGFDMFSDREDEAYFLQHKPSSTRAMSSKDSPTGDELCGVLVFQSRQGEENERVTAFTNLIWDRQQGSLRAATGQNQFEWDPSYPLSIIKAPDTEYEVYASIPPETVAQLRSEGIEVVNQDDVHVSTKADAFSGQGSEDSLEDEMNCE